MDFTTAPQLSFAVMDQVTAKEANTNLQRAFQLFAGSPSRRKAVVAEESFSGTKRLRSAKTGREKERTEARYSKGPSASQTEIEEGR